MRTVHLADPSEWVTLPSEPGRPKGTSLVDWLATLPIVILVVALAIPFVSTRATTPDPLTCAGYPEHRVFLESQSWWRPAGQSGVGAHIHLATCFPVDRVISGVVGFDIRVILHNQLGRAYLVRAGSETTTLVSQSFSLGPCADCSSWVHLDLDTRKLTEGRREFRFTVKAKQPTGLTQFQSTGWQAVVDNDPTVAGTDYRTGPHTEARSWYANHGYQNAKLTSSVPKTAVSGVWTIGAKLAPGSGGLPTSYHMITIDPDFHHGSVGKVIVAGPGPFIGSVKLDTRTLTNGPHKLVLRSDDAGTDGTSSGVEMIVFNVAN